MAPSPNGRIAAVDSGDDGFVELVDMKLGQVIAQIHQFDGERTFVVEMSTSHFVSGSQVALGKARDSVNSPEEVARLFQAIPLQRQSRNGSEANALAKGRSAPKRRMYVLSIGVSKYKYPEYTLSTKLAVAIGQHREPQ